MSEHTLNVGDTQSFVFQPGNLGPLWMSQAERQLNRHHRMLPTPPGEPKKKNKTILERKADLTPLNVMNPTRKKYKLLTKLQELAIANNMDTKKETTREKKGWERQPKGCLQVLAVGEGLDRGQGKAGEVHHGSCN